MSAEHCESCDPAFWCWSAPETCRKPDGRALCAEAPGSDFWRELLESLRLLAEGSEKQGEYASALCCREARRRLINQRTHLEAMHKALDGLPINHIPGAGMDGYRDAQNIRAIVEHLLNQHP